MPTVMVGSALGIFAYVAGHAVFSEVPRLPYIAGAGELAVICGAIAGAGLGFLWFNAYPAEVFMGDVGALALGAALGTIAVIVRQEIVLFIMGGVFVAETLSVMMQVLYFKLTGGKRIFRMAPLHHHYELEGLEGEPGRGALLDHHHDAGAVRPVDAQAPMMREPAFSLLKPEPMALKGKRVLVLGLGDTGLSVARWVERDGRHGARRRYARVAAAQKGFRRRAARRRVRARRCSTASTWSASARACRSRKTWCRRAVAKGIPVRRRHRAVRLAQPARRTVLGDHRHQRQEHRDRARRRTCCAAPASTARWRATSRRRCCDAPCREGTPPARVGARALQLPARDHLVARAATRRRC